MQIPNDLASVVLFRTDEILVEVEVKAPEVLVREMIQCPGIVQGDPAVVLRFQCAHQIVSARMRVPVLFVVEDTVGNDTSMPTYCGRLDIYSAAASHGS